MNNFYDHISESRDIKQSEVHKNLPIPQPLLPETTPFANVLPFIYVFFFIWQFLRCLATGCFSVAYDQPKHTLFSLHRAAHCCQVSVFTIFPTLRLAKFVLTRTQGDTVTKMMRRTRSREILQKRMS